MHFADDKELIDQLRADLDEFEARYKMDSPVFYKRFEAGELGDAMDYIEWASLYQMYVNALAREATHTKNAINRLNSDIANYEGQYGMTSDDFLPRFKSGELGDRMNFIEWQSLLMMRDDLNEHLQALNGEE